MAPPAFRKQSAEPAFARILKINACKIKCPTRFSVLPPRFILIINKKTPFFFPVKIKYSLKSVSRQPPYFKFLGKSRLKKFWDCRDSAFFLTGRKTAFQILTAIRNIIAANVYVRKHSNCTWLQWRISRYALQWTVLNKKRQLRLKRILPLRHWKRGFRLIVFYIWCGGFEIRPVYTFTLPWRERLGSFLIHQCLQPFQFTLPWRERHA